MNNFIMGFILGAVLGFVLALVFPAAAADRGPQISASEWPTYNGDRRARLARAAAKASNPHADWYDVSVHRYRIMWCMDSVFDGEARRYAAQQNLFMMLRACADRTK